MKKTVQVLTAIFCLLFLLAGLGRTLLSPDTEIAYENRPANRLPAFSASAFLRGEFQDGFEDALADQIPMAIRMKKLYNIFDTGAALPVIHALGRDGGYVGFRDICFYHDMLVVRSCPLPERESAAMRESGRLISDRAEASPETEFYVYYIETDRDRNFETETPGLLYDCLTESLRLPADRVSRLRVDSFEDYRRLFFKTDHHWNAEGSRQGYAEICRLLGVEPLPLAGRYSVPACYLGTRAAGVEGVPAEDFAVNLYDFPDMTITIPAGQIPDYGMQALFAAGELENISYGSVYGPDCGELVFDTGRPGKNLLVMGDSYDNAIVKSLAAGFARTCCVDLRSYAAELGHPFVMADYLREHEIDCVLFVGGIDYYGATLLQAEGG